MASARSSCKDILERLSPGSPQDFLLRTCAPILCEPPQSKTPRSRWSTLIRPRPSSSHGKNPSVWTHCLGEKRISTIKKTKHRVNSLTPYILRVEATTNHLFQYAFFGFWRLITGCALCFRRACGQRLALTWVVKVATARRLQLWVPRVSENWGIYTYIPA